MSTTVVRCGQVKKWYVEGEVYLGAHNLASSSKSSCLLVGVSFHFLERGFFPAFLKDTSGFAKFPDEFSEFSRNL